MTANIGCNCVVCAFEFNPDELESLSLTNEESSLKICISCLKKTDPADDYKEARQIASTYLHVINIKTSFEEVKKMIKKL